ncbi:MAG TPA: EAL domain-containing protein [Acidimicrobiales bacterium]|nr:EAL domain-containing protein [Acidimicrobiales bacterium]
MGESLARVVNLRSLPVAALQDDAVIDLRDLEVWYEPQIDLTTGSLVGFEALLRWRHPAHGLLGPERALASADRCGLEVHVLSLVLDHACAEAVAWRDDVDEAPTVAVNVNPEALSHASVVDLVSGVLRRTGLPAAALRLEITEQGGDNAQPSPVVIEGLRCLGVQLALDDVGTGASSLSRARDLHVDQFKIDRSFVSGIDTDRADRAIVAALVSLALALDLDVVAEGIETESQLAVLRELGCEVGQGYLWQRPVPAESARAIVRRRVAFPHPSRG